MRVFAGSLAAAMLLGGCARPAARMTLPPAVQRSAMDQQVMNAVESSARSAKVAELRERVAVRRDDPRPRVELAAEYGRAGYPELELEHLRLAAERFPDSEAVYIDLGRALVRAGHSVEAAQRLSAYLEKHEKSAAALCSWAGIAFDAVGQWKDGEAMHRKSIAAAPERDMFHNNLGYNLYKQGRNEDAASCFRRALDLNPGSETARNNLGLALAERPAEALSQFRQTADLAVAHNNLAAYLYEKGDVEGARRELELAVSYRKDVPQIFTNLRRVAERDGKPIVLEPQPQKSFWKSFARGLKHTFGPDDPKSSTGAVETAR